MESRDSCPCELELDFRAVSEDSLTVVVVGESGLAVCDTVTQAYLAAHSGIKRYSLTRDPMKLDVYHPFGALADPLVGYRADRNCEKMWMFSEKLIPEGERCNRKVVLHKNYCGLTLRANGLGEKGSEICALRFRSSVNGYLPGGGVSEGKFSELVIQEDDRLYRVNLLRQTDDSLLMDMVEDNPDFPTSVLRTFALGEYIAASGYDWTADDLEDLEVDIDFIVSSISLKTSKWVRSVEFNVEF